MSKPIQLSVERLRRLRVDQGDVWQGGVVRMPTWVVPEGKPPFRPRLPIWVSTATEQVATGEAVHAAGSENDAAVDALFRLAENANVRCRPAAVEVVDPALVPLLRERLAGMEIDVRLRDRMPAVESLLEEMAVDLSGPFSVLRSVGMPGVDLARFRAFAEAAAEFHRSALWNHLDGNDPIWIDSAIPDAEFARFTVLGAAGMEYGLGFVACEEDLLGRSGDGHPRHAQATCGGWMLSYGPIMDLPLADSELWERESLPLAGEEAYPFLVRLQEETEPRLADSSRMTFVEGLLRALARTTEDDLDSGRWRKVVPTFGGKTRIDLSLPSILAPLPDPRPSGGTPDAIPDRRRLERVMRDLGRALAAKGPQSIGELDAGLANLIDIDAIPRRAAETPEERAQELVDGALRVAGRRRVKLAREAIRLFPDCADAFVILAENMPDSAQRIALYREGLQAGERALGPACFEEHAGHFWGIVETRPYMRACQGLANCLAEEGNHAEAIDRWREMLRLNPNDNQGVRHLVVPALIRTGRDRDCEGILQQYAEDATVPMSYGRALLAFRRDGDTPGAHDLLAAAVRHNPHLPKYLLAKSEIPDRLPEVYGWRSEEEAVAFGAELLSVWEATPGARAWLAGFMRERKKARVGKRKGKPGH